MFSPEASIQSARSSLRNPRRRPRNSDGPQQQQPRRKRSKLGDETFVSVSDGQSNGNGSAIMNGHVGHSSVEGSMVLVDMPVREKKGPVKRAVKDDTALYLNKNENYSVKKLPSFPPVLASSSTPFRASALSSAGLALALTSDQALLWDYTAAAGPSKVLALPLPSTIQNSDPLPLGAIVRNGPTNEFGVVAVAPSTGKMVFWENVDSAEARSHFPQRSQGVDGSVKLYSGERITDLVDIEHVGYILIFSSGRLAQLTLRDSQGRPSIVTNLLSTPNGSGGSFFSFKGLLGGGIRKTVASVKARPSEAKGQMEIISATRSGLFQMWDLSWSGQQMFKREIDMHGNTLSAVQQGVAPEARSQQDIHVLDFEIMDKQMPPGSISLLTLVALSGRQMLDYFLLELNLSDTAGTVSRAIPLRNFHQPELPKEPVGTVLLPSPGHTAFIQFPTAITVASLAEPEESPEAQLFSDSGSSTLPFQDSIYFREDANVRFTGHAVEPAGRREKNPSVLVFVQDYGILQVSARPPPTTEEEDRRKPTAFSKLYQATFFSTIPGTILDFSTKSRYAFEQLEVENAALSVSRGILKSNGDLFEKVTTSLEDQLRRRAFALRTLNAHLRAEYPPLSFSGRWELLWHAEKLAAATQLWKWYQGKLLDEKAHPEAYPEKVLMGDIVKALNEKYKTPVDPAKGETDPIRQFFLKDINALEILIPWGWNYLRMFYLNSETKERASIMQRLSEANDVFLVTLETGFSFRQENIEQYGLDPDSLVDGVLKPGHGYDMLSHHFWSSSHNIVSSLRSLIDVGRNLAEESFEQGVLEDLAQKIGKDNPRLVRMGCQTHIERFQWALEQSDEKKRETGRTLREEWDKKVRPGHIYGLMDIGLATDGMNLAERYHDMPTLVNLIWDETNWLEDSRSRTQSKMEQAEISVKLNRIKERTARYFKDYGDEWAEAYFSKHITANQSAQLLEKAGLAQAALTRFLRADRSRSRLAWINDVCGEKDYESAGVNLFHAAKLQERNAWCTKVELSIARLALLCKHETKPDGAQPPAEPDEDPKIRALLEKREKKSQLISKNIRDRLEYTKTQDEVYERLLPTVTGALDDDSAIDLLMVELGQGRLVERPALQALVRQGFDALIHHRNMEPCLMVDLLTLMTSDQANESTDIIHSNEFVLAFKVLVLNWPGIQRTARQGLIGLIWKRICLKDDWAQINNTKDISDAALTDFLANTHTGWTFKQLLKMIDKDPSYRWVWPPPFENMYGNGCTDGELCIRFPSEDLRRPIMRDNALDEAIFKDYVEKHRLEDWFAAACRAAKRSLEKEKSDRQQKQLGDVPEVEADQANGPEEERIVESVERAASESFEGDDEQSGADQDVEMQDS